MDEDKLLPGKRFPYKGFKEMCRRLIGIDNYRHVRFVCGKTAFEDLSWITIQELDKLFSECHHDLENPLLSLWKTGNKSDQIARPKRLGSQQVLFSGHKRMTSLFNISIRSVTNYLRHVLIAVHKSLKNCAE